jgi:hypothetical protein
MALLLVVSVGVNGYSLLTVFDLSAVVGQQRFVNHPEVRKKVFVLPSMLSMSNRR